MSETVWRNDELLITTSIGPVALARGPRTRVRITTQAGPGPCQTIALDLMQWEALCNAVRDLGTNPHHAPPLVGSHETNT